MRFTIRDLLWLTALTFVGVAWLAQSHRAALLDARCQALERLNSQERIFERKLLETVVAWANDKGETVAVDTGGYIIRAAPNSDAELLSKEVPDSVTTD